MIYFIMLADSSTVLLVGLILDLLTANTFVTGWLERINIDLRYFRLNVPRLPRAWCVCLIILV